MSDPTSHTRGLPQPSPHNPVEGYLFRLIEVIGALTDRLTPPGDAGVQSAAGTDGDGVVLVTEPAPPRRARRATTKKVEK